MEKCLYLWVNATVRLYHTLLTPIDVDLVKRIDLGNDQCGQLTGLENLIEG